MCLPACTMKLAQASSRRRFFRQAGIAACLDGRSPRQVPRPTSRRAHSFQRVVDLTHALRSGRLPYDVAKSLLVLEQVSKLGKRQVERLSLALAGTLRHPPRCAAALHKRHERRPHTRRSTGWPAGGRGHSRPCCRPGGVHTHARGSQRMGKKAWTDPGRVCGCPIQRVGHSAVHDARKYFGLRMTRADTILPRLPRGCSPDFSMSREVSKGSPPTRSSLDPGTAGIFQSTTTGLDATNGDWRTWPGWGKSQPRGAHHRRRRPQNRRLYRWTKPGIGIDISGILPEGEVGWNWRARTLWRNNMMASWTAASHLPITF